MFSPCMHAHACLNSIAPGRQEEFKNRLEVIIRKRTSIKVTVDEQWVSESEMRTDLKWNQNIGSIMQYIQTYSIEIQKMNVFRLMTC